VKLWGLRFLPWKNKIKFKEHKLFRDSNGQRVQTKYRSREINWTIPAMVKADQKACKLD
jgi:hypothetical protein